MQRWIVAGLVAMLLVVGGTGYAYRSYQQNRPSPVWVPMPLNPDRSQTEHETVARELKGKLDTPEILTRVSKDLNLAKAWGLASDTEAADEIARRLFVKVGEVNTPTGTAPAINVGVDGPVKDRELSAKIAMRLMEDVWKIVGIKPPVTK
jgi:hypothetical protein